MSQSERRLPADSDGTVISPEAKREVEKTLTEIETRSTSRPGSPRGSQQSTSNESYYARGHKSTDRKTGVAQSDEHYTWRQVYRLCEVEGYGHE